MLVRRNTSELYKRVCFYPCRHYWQTESLVPGLSHEYRAGADHSCDKISNPQLALWHQLCTTYFLGRAGLEWKGLRQIWHLCPISTMAGSSMPHYTVSSSSLGIHSMTWVRCAPPRTFLSLGPELHSWNLLYERTRNKDAKLPRMGTCTPLEYPGISLNFVSMGIQDGFQGGAMDNSCNCCMSSRSIHPQWRGV